MNERDFYNESADDDFFREHLAEKGEFPRKRENWLKVAAILDQKQAKKRFWKWFWLVFFLASGNVWQAYCAFTPAQVALVPSLTQVIRDTIFQHDTIYTYIYSGFLKALKLGEPLIMLSKTNNSMNHFDENQNNEIINRMKPFSKDNQGVASNSLSFEKKTYSLQDWEINFQNAIHQNNHVGFSTNGKIINVKSDSLNTLMGAQAQKRFLETPLLENNRLKLLSITALSTELIDETIENLDKPAIRLLKKLPIRIKPIGIGIQQGISKWTAMPANVNLTHWQGLYSDFTFIKNLTFGLSMDYAQLSYKIFELPADGEPFRLPTAPTNVGTDFKLDYIEGAVNAWHLGFGLKYQLSIFPKWQPFLTSGYQLRAILPNKTEFEYTNQRTEDEKSVKIMNEGRTYDHWWFAGVGCSVPIYETWQLQMSAKYIYDNHHGNRALHYGLLQAGLFYRF